MGPADPLHSNAAKVFASFYALFFGLVFIGVLAVFLAPFLYRLMPNCTGKRTTRNPRIRSTT